MCICLREYIMWEGVSVQCHFVQLRLFVAVDDADDNDDGHTREAEQREDHPAILVPTGDNAPKEEGRVASP